MTGTQAQLFGDVVSDVGGDVEYWVEYGPTSDYGSESQHQTVTVEKNVARTVGVTIEGLERATTYHYRLCARDSQQQGGPGCGQDRQFTTVNVDCGDTITADLRLSGDLNCIRFGQRDGPIVGASGIRIDLGGHTLRGAEVALDNRGGFDDVTIRGGTLYAHGVALALEGASRNRIVGVQAGSFNPFLGPPTSTGLRIQGGEANVVRESALQGSSSGLSATDSPGLLVAGSTGMAGSGSRGDGPTVAIRGDLARVLGNSFNSGIYINGSSNRIAANDVRAVTFGINVVAGHGNVVAENEVHDAGIPPWNPDAGDGIVVHADAFGTRLRANVSVSNADDGIDVRSPGTRLRDNRADDNGDFGIEAVEGVIDLGGNTASGNGNPLQCRNVFCG